MTNEQSLIDFPCDFPIKVFGKSDENFSRYMTEIIIQHDPHFTHSNINIRNSKNARYVSLTCTVHATSRAQLDAIYQAICAHPAVTMAL